VDILSRLPVGFGLVHPQEEIFHFAPHSALPLKADGQHQSHFSSWKYVEDGYLYLHVLPSPLKSGASSSRIEASA